jgi:hypothetical protein
MFTTKEQDEFFSQEKCNICFNCEILGVIVEHLIIRVPCSNCKQNNFGCPGCGKKYSTENSLMSHFYEKHSQNSHCIHCGDETSFNRLFSHTVSHFSKTIDKYKPDFNEILDNNKEYEDIPVHVTSPNQIEQTEPLFPSKMPPKTKIIKFNESQVSLTSNLILEKFRRHNQRNSIQNEFFLRGLRKRKIKGWFWQIFLKLQESSF